MENKCSKCGGDLKVGRLMSGAIQVVFAPIEDEKKFFQRNSKVICDTCIECGCIENIRVENPKRIK